MRVGLKKTRGTEQSLMHQESIKEQMGYQTNIEQVASLNLIRGIDANIDGGGISEVEKGKGNERGETEVLQEI